MKRFVLNIFIVLVPVQVVLFYMFFLFVNHNLHYFYFTRWNAHKFILGEPYNDQFIRHYKLKRDFSEYKILAIGSSRVLQFTSDMFFDNFFNLGYTANSTSQICNLIEELDLKNKTLLIGLDQWEFNSKWSDIRDSLALPSEKPSLKIIFNKQKFEDVVKGKIYPVFRNSKSFGFTLIGSGASIAMNGILKDGSYYYGKIYHGILNDMPAYIGTDYKFRDTDSRIKSGTNRFEYAQYADSLSLLKIYELIQNSVRRKNKIIFFFPPFAPTVSKMMDNDLYLYIKDASKKIKDLCNGSNVSFFDFTNPYFSNDKYFIDGFHGGKFLYYKIAQEMQLVTRNLEFINQFESKEDKDLEKLRSYFFNKN